MAANFQGNCDPTEPMTHKPFETVRLLIGYAGYRLAIILALTLAVGVVDSLGLAMFVPVLEIGVAGQAADSRVSVFILRGLDSIGVPPTLIGLLILIVVVFMAKAVVVFGAGYMTARLLVFVQENLRLSFIERVNQADYSFLLGRQVGGLSNVFTTEISGTLSNLRSFVNLISSVAMVAIYLAAAILVNPVVSGLAMLFGVLLIALFWKLNARTRDVSHSVTEKNAAIQNLLLQVLNQVKYLKATAGFGPLMKRLKDQLTGRRDDFYILYRNRAFIAASIEPLAVICVAGFIFYMVDSRGASVGEIVLPLLLLYRSITRVGAIQRGWNGFQASSGPARAFSSTQNGLLENVETHGDGVAPPLEHAIRLENVGYAYENRPTLEQVTISIPRNTSVGIVGATGAGKTTLVDVITGLLAPPSGGVYWDGHNYFGLNLHSLRARI